MVYNSGPKRSQDVSGLRTDQWVEAFISDMSLITTHHEQSENNDLVKTFQMFCSLYDSFLCYIRMGTYIIRALINLGTDAFFVKFTLSLKQFRFEKLYTLCFKE